MNYVSPVKDTKFVLENLLNNPSAIENDLMNSILEEAGKLANENLAPLNHEGDKNPPKLRQDNEVETSPGFKNAFKKIASGGWIGVSSNPDYDGMGLPFRMAAAVSEYWQGANMSFALCNLLSQGLIDALTLVGTDKEKELLEKAMEYTNDLELLSECFQRGIGSIESCGKRLIYEKKPVANNV